MVSWWRSRPPNASALVRRVVAAHFARAAMLEVKDTLRATVRLSYDGRVYKTFHGSDAQERFENEVRVLRHLEKEKCNFVPSGS